MMSSEFISVIIVAWNSKKYLPTCLDALSAQTYRDFEIIIVDNGSTDQSCLHLQEKYSDLQLKVIENNENLGFALANNLGVQEAKGNWIVLLNADAFPSYDWLEQFFEVARKNIDYTFFASRQIQYNNPSLLDGTGDEYHVSGLAWRRSFNYEEKKYGLQQEEVFGACAAAAMYRREDFLKVGGFDEGYFSYFEDVDLSFRLRLVGGRCLYVPDAVVYHIGSASTGKLSDFVVYYGHRNLVWTYIKNMPALLFWLFLPLHLMMNLFFLISFIFKGKGKAIVKAKWDALRGTLIVLRKRKEIQSMRTVSIKEIYRFMRKGLLDPCWASRQRNKRGK